MARKPTMHEGHLQNWARRLNEVGAAAGVYGGSQGNFPGSWADDQFEEDMDDLKKEFNPKDRWAVQQYELNSYVPTNKKKKRKKKR